MTIKALYPNVRPTLNLDFAKTKALDPRVTFTRASTATFVGSNGLIQTAASGAARFDHNPTTGESLGLLVEEARTNVLKYSNDFSQTGSWQFSQATPTYNASTAPDGTQTATRLTTATTTSTQYITSTGTNTVAAGTQTVSAYVKPGTCTQLQLQFNGDINTRICFNLATDSTFNVQANGSNGIGTIANVGNGWKRITLTSTVAATDTVAIYLLQDQWFQLSAGLTLEVWGFQAEAGAFPTSYIPTTTATVTRAADVATLANTGSSIFPTFAFTTVNSPYGTAGGGTTVKLVGPTVKRTAVYNGDLTQTQINALAGVNDDFWRWRVLGSSFALPSFTTDGSVTVDWGDGVVETLTTAVHTFTNGGGYHDIGFRLDSGTYFRPTINDNASHDTKVAALGPAPESMKLGAFRAFSGCSNLEAFDATVDATGGTDFNRAWQNCSSLTSFPLLNTAAGTSFDSAWNNCSSLTNFPLINTAAGTNFSLAWNSCSSLTSFPLINTAAGTNFSNTWNACSSLTSFPLIDTAAGTNFSYAWKNCPSLTNFPEINTAAGTNFLQTWYNCSSLTSFPLINTAAGTNFQSAWGGCSGLTSFPLINTAAGTNFSGVWDGCSSLTSFPLINTGAGTNFSNTWNACSSLTSFPLIDTSAGTTFNSTWKTCSSLTSFPLVNTAAGTSFSGAWQNCSSLTSFPLIDTAAGTNFSYAWQNCSSLTSFPLINTAAGTNFDNAWRSCSSLTSFPANMFDTTGTLVAGAFTNAFQSCALTATSIENILTSLVTNGQSNITLTLNGGTNAGASTWTANAVTAYNTLISRGWTISRNA